LSRQRAKGKCKIKKYYWHGGRGTYHHKSLAWNGGELDKVRQRSSNGTRPNDWASASDRNDRDDIVELHIQQSRGLLDQRHAVGCKDANMIACLVPTASNE